MFGDEPIDLEGADDPDVQAQMPPETVRQSFLGSVQMTAEKMDFDDTSTETLKEEIGKATERVLSEAEDLDGVLEGLETDGLADAIRRNIEAAEEGLEW